MPWDKDYWQKRVRESLAMAPGDAVQARVKELTELYGIVGEKVESIIENENEQENSRFAAAVASAVIECSTVTAITGDNDLLIDLSLGLGDLAWMMIPIAKGLNLRYLGIDPNPVAHEHVKSRLSRLNFAEGFELIEAEAGKLLDVIPSQTAQIVIWGRIGLHLSRAWLSGVMEIPTLLKPGGVFVLAETVTDFNEHLFVKSVKHENTKVRSIWEYSAALPGMKLFLCRSVPYWKEHLAIAAWQKPLHN